ncbi:MAG: ATP phosphoribosyltransferase regulatory subunit [Gammaproteobacteria bacterium]|nr:ATP phosphoribosyltransferase regulatory subunit [Gammaproteobacteria bacterium]
MLKTDSWKVPAGIDDILPPAAEQVEQLRRRLLDLFHGWGYALVIPPLAEFTDSLLAGMGADLEEQTFRLTDAISGKSLGIRADITPQVARIDAHHLHVEGVVRLCYFGSVLKARQDGLASRRNPLQFGAEIYGHGGWESDVEILTLMAAALDAAGVGQSLHIDLGHVGFYRALVASCELSPALEHQLFDALQRKATPEIVGLLGQVEMAAIQREMLQDLCTQYGRSERLAEVRTRYQAAGADAIAALDELEAITRHASRRIPDAEIFVDLSELRGYNYHTGLVFAAYVPGCGRAVAQGGRYDQVGASHGIARPATGFSAELDTLIDLVSAPTDRPRGILAPWTESEALLMRVAELRSQGERVVYRLPGELAPAIQCDRQLSEIDGDWCVEPIVEQG